MSSTTGKAEYPTLDESIIARRSSAHIFSGISNAVGLALCIAAAILFSFRADELFMVLSIIACIFTAVLACYHFYMLFKTPKVRISFIGGMLKLHMTRKHTVKINPSDIQDFQERPGTFLITGAAFRQDGAITILENNTLHNMRHINESRTVLKKLREIRQNAQN